MQNWQYPFRIKPVFELLDKMVLYTFIDCVLSEEYPSWKVPCIIISFITCYIVVFKSNKHVKV